jgi:hypothetical protein
MILFEQDSVKFALNFFVGDLSVRRKVVNTTVAGTIERIMAQISAEICIICNWRSVGKEDIGCLCEKFPSREMMHAIALGMKRMMRKGFVVIEQIRAVQSDIKKIFFL